MEVPFTEDELRAIREADAEIERIFEAEYFKSRKDHVEMDKMLDSEIVKDRKSRNIEAYQKAYREANKDKLAAYQKAYYEANKDKLAAYQKAYYEANIFMAVWIIPTCGPLLWEMTTRFPASTRSATALAAFFVAIDRKSTRLNSSHRL